MPGSLAVKDHILLPLDMQMQRNYLGAGERVEVAGITVAYTHQIRLVLVFQTQHIRGIHMYGKQDVRERNKGMGLGRVVSGSDVNL